MKWFDAGTQKMSVPSFSNFSKLINVQCTGSWSRRGTESQSLTDPPELGQKRLAAPKLQQPWVHLVDVASSPAESCLTPGLRPRGIMGIGCADAYRARMGWLV